MCRSECVCVGVNVYVCVCVGGGNVYVLELVHSDALDDADDTIVT